MPEAIATTKRKFYRALDALTISSNAASHSTKAPTAAAAFDEARERARKRLRHSISSTIATETASSHDTVTSSRDTLSRIITPRTSVSLSRPTSTTPSSSHSPNFTPWSQDEFLARLKTFSNVSLWHPKPEAIGEVEWAKRGWVCVGSNTVACKGGCEQRVIVSLENTRSRAEAAEEVDAENGADKEGDEDEDESTSLERAMVERYLDIIVSSHSSSCLWRKAGCKDDIYRLPIVRPTVWQPALRQRVVTLLDIHQSLDGILLHQPSPTPEEAVLSPEKLLTDLPSNVLTPSILTHSSAAKALRIALHGWRGSPDPHTPLLTCDTCFQRIGLWMYQPSYKPRTLSSDDETPTPSIDLHDMHRDHCPWRSSSSQQAIGSLAGLNASQILIRVASTCARDYRRRSAAHDTFTSAPISPESIPPPTDSLSPAPSARSILLNRRAQIAQQDKERESRLRKLKSLFSIKRRSTTKPTTSAH